MNAFTPFQMLNALPDSQIAAPRDPCVPCWIAKAQASEANMSAAAIRSRVQRRERALRCGQNRSTVCS